MAAYFTSYQRVGEVLNPYAREQGTTIMVGSSPTTALLTRVRQ
ncbi:hypothetical protein [Hymenobacter sp. NBH84]|nr:hypothetical protein [Hymenobacter sp. NBH84]